MNRFLFLKKMKIRQKISTMVFYSYILVKK